MGKTKNKSRKANNARCPTGLPSVRDIVKEEEEFGCESDHDDHAAGTHNGSIKPVIKSIIEKVMDS